MRSARAPHVVVQAALQFGFDAQRVTSMPGASRQTWRVADHILRVRPRRELEVELAAVAAARTVLPVPRVLATAEVGDMSAALLELLPGVPAGRLDGLTTAEARRRGEHCGYLHRLVGSVTAPDLLPAANRSGVAGTTARTATSLLHLDLHPFNVLLGDGGEVTGVLDWANAARGDPDLDRARTLSILTLDPAARQRRVDPRWQALTQGWIDGGELATVPDAARVWAYRYTLADLGRRYPDVQLSHIRAALDDIDASA